MSAADKAKLDGFNSASHYITDVSDKADKVNTVIFNSLSMSRLDNTTVGSTSVALGSGNTASGA
jgi:hypothetical protein